MKRAEILKKLEGVENADEIVDFVMSENGKDIEKAKVDTTGFEQKIAELQTSLKQYEQGGEKYIDLNEFNRLKQFENDTKQNQIYEQKNKAVIDWLKTNKASEKALNLLAKTVDYNKIELEDGKIKNEDVFKDIKNEYKDFFVETEQGGVIPSNTPVDNHNEAEPKTLSEAIAQEMKK